METLERCVVHAPLAGELSHVQQIVRYGDASVHVFSCPFECGVHLRAHGGREQVKHEVPAEDELKKSLGIEVEGREAALAPEAGGDRTGAVDLEVLASHIRKFKLREQAGSCLARAAELVGHFFERDGMPFCQKKVKKSDEFFQRSGIG